LISTKSVDTDGSWTRVGTAGKTAGLEKSKSAAKREKKRALKEAGAAGSTPSAGSDAGTGSGKGDNEVDDEDDAQQSFLLSESANSVPRDNRRTLAEKLLPKPRKTGVDDMLETPQYPTLARVMRVQPQPHEKPAEGFTWADYEDVDASATGAASVLAETSVSGSRLEEKNKDPEADTGDDEEDEDDGWGVVKSRKPKRTTSAAGTPSSSQTLTSSSLTATAAESLTKKQRQNQRKKEAEKAAKADAESARLAALAKHKRELEQAKIAEHYKSQGQAGATGGGRGGRKASVEGGRLVWD
jgi:hypothetical protein